MTALFLPGLVARGKGGILQIASVIGFSPCPYQAVYAATKAFVLSFAHGLAVELEGTGVRVTAICPGHMRTGFQVSAGFSTNALPVPGELSVEETVRLGLLAYEKRRTVVVTGFVNWMSVFFGGLLPRSWIARLSARVLKKLGRFD
jgi:short-subunit dehydrogenase